MLRLLTSICLRVFLFHAPVSQQRGSTDAQCCHFCRLSPFRACKDVLKKRKQPNFNTRRKAPDSPQTLQQCYWVNLHPQPPVSPAWPVSSSVSRLDAPWFAAQYAVRDRPPFTGMSGHRGPCPPVIGLDPPVLVPWLATTCVLAAQGASLRQPSHQGN